MVVTSDAYDALEMGLALLRTIEQEPQSPVCGSECTTGQSWNEAATSSEQL
jgi:hypothetical protein